MGIKELLAVVAALIGVIDGIYRLNSYLSAGKSDSRKLDIKFKRSTLFEAWFISEDNTMISNIKIPDARFSSTSGFRNYFGVMADRCIKNNESLLYQVSYSYEIVCKLTEFRLLLEIGLAEYDKIDNAGFVGELNAGGWSYHLLQDGNAPDGGIVMRGQHLTENKVALHQCLNISPNKQRITKNGTFSVVIDRVRHEFSIYDDKRPILTFENVTSDRELCPVFGVYNRHFASVQLRLLQSSITQSESTSFF